MADRRSLLARLVEALEHPDVDGVLGSPDIVEELLLLGALDGKVVIGVDEPRLARSRSTGRCAAGASAKALQASVATTPPAPWLTVPC